MFKILGHCVYCRCLRSWIIVFTADVQDPGSLCLLQVFKILDQFPNITFLNISCNPLTILDHPPDKCYENMVKLVLNSLHLPWDSVQQVLHIVPK